MLLVKSLWRITAYPAGFDPEHVLTLKVQMSVRRTHAERKPRTSTMCSGRPEPCPGVFATGLYGCGRANPSHPPGGPPMSILDRPIVRLNVTSGGIRRGNRHAPRRRTMMTDDAVGFVYVINEALARRTSLARTRWSASVASERTGSRTRDPVRSSDRRRLRTADLESAIEPELFLDYPHGQSVCDDGHVRTTGDPLHVAPTVRRGCAIDPTKRCSR